MTPHYQVTQGCRIGGDVPQGRLWGAGIKCESAKVSKYKMQKCMRKYFRNLFTTQVPTACYKSVVLRLSGKLQNLFLIKRSCCCCVFICLIPAFLAIEFRGSPKLGAPCPCLHVYDLLNGAIFNDLERSLPPVSRSRHSLTLNISETVRDTDIVSTEY